MPKKLSYRLKKEYYSLVVQRDGYQCPYCIKPFSENNPAEWEHYNNNDGDNRLDNLALVHHSCNNRKKTDFDLQCIGNDNLKKNEKSVFACEIRQDNTGTTDQLSSQQEVSKINFQITKQWIQEHTLAEKQVLLRDAVNAIVAICKDNNGTGSQAAIYRYIDTMTNPYNGKYTLAKNASGKDIIQRKSEN